MAAPARYDFSIYQGETWTSELQVLDVNNDPVNLAGYTAGMTLRNSPGDPDAHLVLTTGGSGITIDTVNGKIGLAMTAAQTAALAFSKAHYDVFIRSSGGTVTYLIYGTVTLIPRVSVP